MIDSVLTLTSNLLSCRRHAGGGEHGPGRHCYHRELPRRVPPEVLLSCWSRRKILLVRGVMLRDCLAEMFGFVLLGYWWCFQAFRFLRQFRAILARVHYILQAVSLLFFSSCACSAAAGRRSRWFSSVSIYGCCAQSTVSQGYRAVSPHMYIGMYPNFGLKTIWYIAAI